MKACVTDKPGSISVVEVETPTIKPDEVLVKVRSSGICVNDVRDFKGNEKVTYPRIGGHEFVGEIVAMGADVNTKRFHIGQKVIPYIIDNCNECVYCKNGLTNICPDFPHTKAYKNPNGYSGFFGFGQYYAAKAYDLYIVKDEVPYEHAALVEPMACALNSVNRTGIEFGDDVLVIGGGTMGMLHVMFAAMRGARVILSEPMAERREKALQCGAKVVIDPINQNVEEELAKLTDGQMAKVVFDTTAVPALAVQAINCTGLNGTTVMFSSLHPNNPVEVNLGAIHSSQRNITGAQNGSVKTYLQAVEMLNKGIFDPTPLIEAVYDYKDIKDAMDCACRPDTYKVVVNFDD